MPSDHEEAPTMKLISVVTGCYNEEGNVRELYTRIARVFAEQLPGYDYECIFIDNASQDGTVAVLREMARHDGRVKIIVNNRNFGVVRSGYYAILQATGDAVIGMASDLQDPPELIPEFVRKWEEGFKIVLAQKTESDESSIFYSIRTAYYRLINKLSDLQMPEHVTGFGLYDRRVVEDVRRVDDPYPYFRGMICDFGYEICLIPFRQPLRKSGLTSNNFYSHYDLAMLGITNHSKVPLRLAVFSGFLVAAMSLVVALGYLIYKIVFWSRFEAGSAPLVIGLFFLGAVQLIFIGILGEYIGSIHTQVLNRPKVIEKERINFE
jgi:glycosyltransferase involved in cell wall biosynthesis